MQTTEEQLEKIMLTGLVGSVLRTDGLAVSVAGFPAPVGATVEIERQSGNAVFGEVVGFRDNLTLVYPFNEMGGVRRGNKVTLRETIRQVPVGEKLLGRVINAHGKAIDNKPDAVIWNKVPLYQSPPSATERPRIEKPLGTGVHAIDGLLTCGQGQRIGIFAGSGVGKSTVLGMLSRHSEADVNVIALIGERGREVNDFLERDLGPEGLARSIVVVSTSDEPALLRLHAAMTATAIAEYFRDEGKNVLLMMDSLTRFAMAQREIGLAAGEPPTTKGYPPSVFSLLPKLVERAGRNRLGSITAYYTVLVEGDDHNEPVSDAVRGLLDGHVILSRKFAAKGHYPAIDVLQSISRIMPDVASAEQIEAATKIRQLLAAYQENEDLITIGAYQTGSNPLVDTAIAFMDQINHYIKQEMDEEGTLEVAQSQLLTLTKQLVLK
ncbi:MAG: FliI/YscN family ATPase [Pirellulaceae bacterium]|nr:FliI/YscN family ATPase [Pirellulaceae bacterium]